VKAQEVYFLDGNTFQNHHGGFILVGDYIYGGHGHTAGAPICIEFLTGKVMWKTSQPAGGSAAVAYADGRLYFRYESGSMVLIEATPEKYSQKGMFTIPVKTVESWPHPSIAGGCLYLRDNDTLMCFDIKKK
jgi:outer membrane protein assembly factor BamB